MFRVVKFLCKYETKDNKCLSLYETNTHFEIYLNNKLIKWINFFHIDPIIREHKRQKYKIEIQKEFFKIMRNLNIVKHEKKVYRKKTAKNN